VFTVGGKPLVTAEQAKARYNAAIDWIRQRGLGVISNGPYVLAKYDPPSQFAELQAFRDPTYPFKPGDLYKGAPSSVAFQDVQMGAVVANTPLTVTARVQGPGETKVRYLLMDPVTGKAVASGDAQSIGQGQFKVELSAQDTAVLAVGPEQLFLVASSDKVSTLAERRVDLQPGAMPQVTTTVVATPTPAKKGGGFSCSGPPLKR